MAKGQPVAAGEAAGEEAGAGPLLIDLSGVQEEKALPVIPKGVYPATVDEVSFGMSQASGNPMWTWKLEIADGDFAGRKLFFHTPFVENMLPRVKKILSRVAPEVLNGPFKPEEVANSGILVGKSCKVRVDIQPYQGQQRNNVRDILSAADGGNGAGFLNA